jgi:adenosylmethionine---8-amino-7-oxononanoate aminotransferase
MTAHSEPSGRPPSPFDEAQTPSGRLPSRCDMPPVNATQTAQWRDWDLAHVWHPFTDMTAYAREHAPLIVSADGFWLTGDDGRRYLDGHSSLWCNIHGHRVPELDQALVDQIGRVAHSTLLGLSNAPSVELARALVERAPAGLNHVFYTDCGAAGVEAALKIAFQYHRLQAPHSPRQLFACLGRAYHGDTVGTVSLGGIDRFHSLFGALLFPTLRIPSPAETPWDECLRVTEQLLRAHQHQLAGVIVEPLVQAAAGILVHPPGYLAWLRERTRELGLLLIADEIAVGFGRLGTLFACEQEQVSPDLLVLSKGLTGGYLPLAATLVTDDIYNAFQSPMTAADARIGDSAASHLHGEDKPTTSEASTTTAAVPRTFYHGHTYTGNPLACAVALASLHRIESHGVLQQARESSDLLRDELVQPLRHWGCPLLEVRQRGTFVGIAWTGDPLVTSSPGNLQPRSIGERWTRACRDRGVIVRNVGPVLIVLPAPAMPLELVRWLAAEVFGAVTEVLKGLPTA